MDETRLPGYRILGQLGQGGMGVVYRALDTATSREVAVKLLPPRLADDELAQGLFLREAILNSTLDHPNITRVLGGGEAEDGRYFMVSELLRGRGLQEILRVDLPPVARALDIAAQVASGLGAAHAKGVLHRDIKPSNLMLVAEGRVKILDFGLARFTAAAGDGLGGRALGTAHYSSPEQIRGEETDGRTDLWSLGIVLFEMLVGAIPFHGSDRWQTLDAVLTHDPSPVSIHNRDVPPEVDAIVARALAKDREERYASASEMCVALEALSRQPAAERSAPLTAGDRSEVAGPVAPAPRRRWWRRRSN